MTLLTSLLSKEETGIVEKFKEVNTFADLPASAPIGSVYQVLNSTGIILVNRKVKGLYFYDGANWESINGLEANKVLYNNTDSNLSSLNVKSALDELDTSKISADGSVTTHNDVTSAGSGEIITVAERNNLNNQSGTNTGDETTTSIQTKRPLKTIEGQSIEGAGNIDLDKNDIGLDQVDNTSDATKNSATATLTNKTINADNNTISNIDNNDIKNGANIDAGKIGTGIITNTEFNYLDNASSNIQAQLNSKEPIITAGTTSEYLRGDKTFQTLDKNAVGLGNVQNIDTTIAANINYSNTSSGLTSANVQAAVDELSSLIIPVGSFILYPVASIPSGYVIANGAALNKVTYSNLYSAYGNFYGETTQTFNIPDLLSFGPNFGMFIRAGNFSNVGRVQDESVGSHNHLISSVAWNNQDGFAKRFRRALASGSFYDNFSTDNNTGTTENRPKAFTALVLIKY